MGFLIFPKPPVNGGGGGGEVEAPVKSVNGMIGHIFLTHRDLNAVQNLQSSVGGLMVGKMVEMPRTPAKNSIFISTDRVPNSVYIYNRNRWEQVGDSEGLEAIGILFDDRNAESGAKTVQGALDNAFYQIKSGKQDLNKGLDRIDRDFNELSKQLGQVRLREEDELKYLSESLDKTLKVEDGILTVKGIQGVMSTIKELNALRGITSNVQQQIDNLSKIGSIVDLVDTYADLLVLELTGIQINDIVVVLEDENHDNETTFYILDKSRNWRFMGIFDLDLEIRNFIENPIKLEEEVQGILSEKMIDSLLVRRKELTEAIEKVTINSTDDVEEGEVNKYFTQEGLMEALADHKDFQQALALAHEHNNLSTLEEIGETDDGLLTFRGQLLGSGEGGGGGVSSDGRVKINANDVLGYLGSKLDNKTLTTDGKTIEAKSLKDLVATVEELNYLTDVRENIQEQLDFGLGRVRVDKYDEEIGYLGEKIDRNTLSIADGKLIAQRLNGQEVTVSELNYSKGLEGNIQEQLNALSKVGSFTAIVDSLEELANIPTPLNGDLALVTSDSEHEGMTTFYMYDRGEWVFAGQFHIELRNFKTDPIRLTEEVIGVLPEANIDPIIVRREELEDYEVDSTDVVPEGEKNKYFTDRRVEDNKEVKQNTENRHSHKNMTTVEELGEDSNGRLIFKGREIGVSGEILWGEF